MTLAPYPEPNKICLTFLKSAVKVSTKVGQVKHMPDVISDTNGKLCVGSYHMWRLLSNPDNYSLLLCNLTDTPLLSQQDSHRLRNVFSQTAGFCTNGRDEVSPAGCEYICLTSLTRAKCGVRSTLCCKVGNISGST